MLNELYWLSVHNRIEFKINLPISRSLNGTGPKYITNLLECNTTNRRSTDDPMLLRKPILGYLTMHNKLFRGLLLLFRILYHLNLVHVHQERSSLNMFFYLNKMLTELVYTWHCQSRFSPWHAFYIFMFSTLEQGIPSISVIQITVIIYLYH